MMCIGISLKFVWLKVQVQQKHIDSILESVSYPADDASSQHEKFALLWLT